ncbi:hypothetical protein ABW20_dc0104723 [Dactylellina cionopaga]|nr:hypothetical protein ABW20_dc0104723 [Dactylellina cionopaga]
MAAVPVGRFAIQSTQLVLGVAVTGVAAAVKIWMDSEDAKKDKDAKAPGKPTEKDGFIPDKKTGGNLVKVPNSNQKGYKDNKGRYWIPTGEGSGAGRYRPHGGPHWDRLYPDGTHDNVYPGGHVRGGSH